MRMRRSSSTSRKPSVVTTAVSAPRSSSTAFVATVVPCTTSSAPPSDCTASTTARSYAGGVESTFVNVRRPPSLTTTSVNVPPTSAPTRVTAARDRRSRPSSRRLDLREDLALALLERLRGGEQLGRVRKRHDHDAVGVRCDEIAGLDPNAADLDRDAQLGRTVLRGLERRRTEMEDGKADRLELAAVADRTVEDEPRDAACARGRRDDAAAVRAPALAADSEHDHVARRGLGNRAVQREIVTGRRPGR